MFKSTAPRSRNEPVNHYDSLGLRKWSAIPARWGFCEWLTMRYISSMEFLRSADESTTPGYTPSLSFLRYRKGSSCRLLIVNWKVDEDVLHCRNLPQYTRMHTECWLTLYYSAGYLLQESHMICHPLFCALKKFHRLTTTQYHQWQLLVVDIVMINVRRCNNASFE